MYQPLNSFLAERLRLEALQQVRPSSFTTRDEYFNNFHSLLAGNLRRPELASNWHPGLNLGLLPPELQPNLLSSQLMQANPEVKMPLLDPRDRLAENKFEEARNPKTPGAAEKLPHQTGPSAISPKAKKSGDFVNALNFQAKKPGNVSKLIKNSTNKQISDKIKPTIQKDLRNNLSKQKQPEPIVIDDDPKTEGTNETEKNEDIKTNEVPKEHQHSGKLPDAGSSKAEKATKLNHENSSGKIPPTKKPGSSKVSYDEKINSLQSIEVGPNKPLEASQSAGSNSRLPNELPTRISPNPLPYYGGYLYPDYSGLQMPAFPGLLPAYANNNPSASMLALQMLSQNMAGRKFLEDLLMQQLLFNTMAQSVSWPQINPLAGVAESSTKPEIQEAEKAMRFAFEKDKENKSVLEKSKKEIIQITDDNGDATEINETSSGQMIHLPPTMEKRLFGENKVHKKIFQIKTNRPSPKKRELSDASKNLRSHKTVAEIAEISKKEKIPMSALIPKALRKTRSSCSKEIKVKADVQSPLQENLEQQKKLTRASAKAQGSIVASTLLAAESQLKKERRKNKLQIIAEERDGLDKETKEIEVKEEEEEYASLCNYPNPLKRIKPTKIGEGHQAVIPMLELNQVQASQPRKFKTVWNPDRIGEAKVKEFLSAAREILNIDTYHEDFLLRLLLSKDQMDCEKLLNLLQSNQDYFTNLFKQKRSFNPLKRAQQLSQLLQQQIPLENLTPV